MRVCIPAHMATNAVPLAALSAAASAAADAAAAAAGAARAFRGASGLLQASARLARAASAMLAVPGEMVAAGKARESEQKLIYNHEEPKEHNVRGRAGPTAHTTAVDIGRVKRRGPRRQCGANVPTAPIAAPGSYHAGPTGTMATTTNAGAPAAVSAQQLASGSPPSEPTGADGAVLQRVRGRKGRQVRKKHGIGTASQSSNNGASGDQLEQVYMFKAANKSVTGSAQTTKVTLLASSIPMEGPSRDAFRPEQRVCVHGLVASSDLNGKEGTALEWDEQHQRWHVCLDGGHFINLNAANMKAVHHLQAGRQATCHKSFDPLAMLSGMGEEKTYAVTCLHDHSEVDPFEMLSGMGEEER